MAFAVSRRFGTAVVRNLFRRRLRAVMRELSDPGRGVVFPSGDYLVRPRRAAVSAGYRRLRSDAVRVLEVILAREGER